eukprot:g56923.t1
MTSHPLTKQGGPFETKQFAFELEGVKTEVVMTPFSDKIFIVITQDKKLGTMVLARSEDVLGGLTTDTTYSVQTLLGRRDDQGTLLLARQLIEDIAKSGARQSLLLALNLRKPAKATTSEDWEGGAGALQGRADLSTVKRVLQTVLEHKRHRPHSQKSENKLGCVCRSGATMRYRTLVHNFGLYPTARRLLHSLPQQVGDGSFMTKTGFCSPSSSTRQSVTVFKNCAACIKKGVGYPVSGGG